MRRQGYLFWVLIGLIVATGIGARCTPLPGKVTEPASEPPGVTLPPALPIDASPLLSPLTTPTPHIMPITLPTAQTATPPPSEYHRPPIDKDFLPPTPAETAQADLAHRLHVDIGWIKVTEIVAREPNTEDMPCLARDSVPEGLWMNLDEVQWISLSVKGNVHHYVALGDLVIYCDR